jgi:phosphonate transport system permease protein
MSRNPQSQKAIEAEILSAKKLLPAAFNQSARDRFGTFFVWASFSALTLYTLVIFDFSPQRLINGLGKLGHVLSFMFPPYIWKTWEEFFEPLKAIAETLAMAFLGTALAAIVALPLGFLGARNVLPNRFFRFGVRRGFDLMRSLEQIILALIFIRAFGLGPLAGVFAIAVSDIGSLSKLFAEAIENSDRKPVEGLQSAGAGQFQIMRLAIIPQILPVLASQVLYYFESNTRSASILGVVGAGGIGYLLSDRIGANNWPEVMAILLLLLVTISTIDAISGRLRRALINDSRRDNQGKSKA